MEKQINLFARQQLNRMRTQLEVIALENHEILPRTVKSRNAVKDTLILVKDFVCAHAFLNKQEEIEFFKSIKPDFVSQYLCYEKIIELKLNEPFADNDALRKYYIAELFLLQQAAKSNPEFYLYWLTRESCQDEQYFTRQNTSRNNPDLDDRFCSPYDHTLALVLSNQMLKDYVVDVIDKLSTPHAFNPALTWTTSKTDMIELVYALHSSGVFNQGKADIKMVASALETIFNVRLGNLYRTFQEIRLRKTGRTAFLDTLKSRLEKRMDEFDI